MIEYTDNATVKVDFLTECCRHSQFRHPNIVQFIGVYWRTAYSPLPALVMEKMDYTLRALVERSPSFPLHKVLSILHDVSLGVWYLHCRDPPFIHRDLTPNNVFVNTTSLVAKISDFAVMRVVSPYSHDRDDMTKVPGTPDFMAPEAVSQRPSYGLPLDVFSYGGVALFTIAGEWPSPTDREVIDPKTDSWVIVSEVERRKKYLNKIKGDVVVLRILVEECLHNNPNMRPTMENISTRIKEIKEDYVRRHPDVEVSTYVIHYSYTV